MRLIYNSDFINAMQANREKFGVLAMPIENAICDIVSNLPTIDAVQVIRCKDCKHHIHGVYEGSICELSDLHVKDEDYCSKAKEGEYIETY